MELRLFGCCPSRPPNSVISASAARSRPTLKCLFCGAVLSSQLHLELPTFLGCAGNKRDDGTAARVMLFASSGTYSFSRRVVA